MFFLILLAFDVPDIPNCTIDQCDEHICIVETPEGWMQIPMKRYYKEGMKIECNFEEVIEPT